VDAGDFLKWQTQLTIGPAASPAGTGVPEPASLVLAVLSVAGWAGLAKRRRV
jgi:hypothetical protein